MSGETIETLIIGGGQAGLAMSEQLSQRRLPHLIVERHRIAERWRSERWDSLRANGPAWHDRLPALAIADTEPDDFASRDAMVAYFEAYAEHIAAPIRCGVEVLSVTQTGGQHPFMAETAAGRFMARNLVVATGPFQRPHIPALLPAGTALVQLHSSGYRNPAQLPAGAILVVGAGSSGVQIADEVCRAGRRVFLCVGPHERPPRRYRGQDFCWWLGKLGLWDATARAPSMEHVTIAVSGAYGGHTVDFRRLAASGVTLLGSARAFADGVLQIAPDLASNIAKGDRTYFDLLDAADAYVARHHIDLPDDPAARQLDPDPESVRNPITALDLNAAGISTVIWATGYKPDFGWLKAGPFDARGMPHHHHGISDLPGLYFLGLSWLSRRASSFIFGVSQDAAHLADHMAANR